MISRPSWLSLAIGLLLVQPIISISSDVVQLNLVFPRNNTVYKPVFPFPIVFSVQNAARIWQYSPKFAWQLSRQWDDPYLEPISTFGGFDRGNNESRHYIGDRLPPERFFLIRGNKAIVNANLPVKLMIQYFFTVGPRCFAAKDGTGGGSDPADQTFGKPIFFELNWNGTDPNVLANGTCSTPLGTIGISGEGSGLDMYNRTCPTVMSPAPPPDPCGLKIDEDTVYRVEKAMIRQSNCDMKSWPDPKFNGTCQRSSAERLSAGRWPALLNLSIIAFLSTCIGFF
jgi:hypothetical protein